MATRTINNNTAGEGLFGTTKQCEFCHRALPAKYEGTLCPNCMDRQLFHEVREYIRANVVNEYQVAEHFNIPLKQVKDWIHEGRIEYRAEDPAANLSAMHCQNCGAPITFGSLCPKCLRNANVKKVVAAQPQFNDDTKMRYITHDKNNVS
ncbi:MAG: hypothetical protein LUI02_06360 [Clostridiales bacterium]|nr:hypothetical protein [Clostridiales bacterium]